MIERILERLTDIPHDFLLHFLVGYGILITTLPFGRLFAVIVVITLAIVKEIYDYFHPMHEFSVIDIVASVLPLIVLLEI